jgi:serine O-acetyltransferase
LSTNETPNRQPVSAEIADWTRERKSFTDWLPSRSLLASIRAYQRHANAAGMWHRLGRRLALLRHRFWSVVTGADIPLNCRLGGGLLLPHPNGIVIHPGATVGVNCLIFQQVTIGAGGRPGVPRIGGHVDIGAGAKILGGVTVGDHARIGANAVVLDDVAPGATAVGIPARLVGTAP